MRLVSVGCDSGVFAACDGVTGLPPGATRGVDVGDDEPPPGAMAAEGVEGLVPGACDGVPDFPPAAAGGIGSAWVPSGLAGAGVPGATAAEGAAGAAGPVAGTCGDDVPGFMLLGGVVPGVTAADGADDGGIAFGTGNGRPLVRATVVPVYPEVGWPLEQARSVASLQLADFAFATWRPSAPLKEAAPVRSPRRGGRGRHPRGSGRRGGAGLHGGLHRRGLSAPVRDGDRIRHVVDDDRIVNVVVDDVVRRRRHVSRRTHPNRNRPVNRHRQQENPHRRRGRFQHDEFRRGRRQEEAGAGGGGAKPNAGSSKTRTGRRM